MTAALWHAHGWSGRAPTPPTRSPLPWFIAFGMGLSSKPTTSSTATRRCEPWGCGSPRLSVGRTTGSPLPEGGAAFPDFDPQLRRSGRNGLQARPGGAPAGANGSLHVDVADAGDVGAGPLDRPHRPAQIGREAGEAARTEAGSVGAPRPLLG